MVNTRSAKRVQRLPNIFRRTFLTGVRHHKETFRASSCEYLRKFLRGMTFFSGIQPNASKVVTIRQGGLESLHGVFGAQVAQEAQDQF